MSAFRPRSTPLFLRTFSVQSKKAATPGQVGREEERKNPVSFLGTLPAAPVCRLPFSISQKWGSISFFPFPLSLHFARQARRRREEI